MLQGPDDGSSKHNKQQKPQQKNTLNRKIWQDMHNPTNDRRIDNVDKCLEILYQFLTYSRVTFVTSHSFYNKKVRELVWTRLYTMNLKMTN
jgi:hypothetical protein